MTSKITQKLIPQLELTILTAIGELTYIAQKKILVQFYTNSPTKNALWDLRHIEGSRITNQELRLLIEYMKDNKHTRPSGKTALVTSSKLDFGIARMGALLSEVEETAISVEAFSSMEEALQWIEGD